MNYLIEVLEGLGAEVYVGLTESEDLDNQVEFVTSRALGRTFCTKSKVVVFMSYTGFIRALPQLTNVGMLNRNNFYAIVSLNTDVDDKDLVKPRSLAFGMGFSVFRFTSSYTKDSIKKSVEEIVPKLGGPICLFIEGASLNG